MAQEQPTRDYAPPMDPRSIRLLQCAATATLGLALSACGSTGGGSTHTGTTPNPSKTQSPVTTKPVSATTAGKCASARAPVPKGAQSIPKPTLTLNPARRYVVDLSTNCGTIQIQLDVRRAPRTTASFAYLVKRGFYDRLTFHRVAAGFVIQGGDPDGDGSGGPGYTVVEPPPSDMRYTLGTVAMAKTGTDPPVRRAASSSSSPPRRPPCLPNTPWSETSWAASRPCRRSRSSQPTLRRTAPPRSPW